jgi:hypothetical protein
MLLQITVGSTVYTIAVVEGMDIQLEWNGGTEPHYGSDIEVHSRGTRKATFDVTRWYFSDTHKEGLFFSLFENETKFTLSGLLQDNAGNPVPSQGNQATIAITNCMVYKFKPVTGAANDVIGEEASGSATNWITTIIPNT